MPDGAWRHKDHPMFDLDLLLKNNELCFVGRDQHHDEMHAAGLYVRDTRFLNRCKITFDGHEMQVLDLQTAGADLAVVSGTNPLMRQLDEGLVPHTVLMRQQIALDTALVVTLSLRNFGMSAISGLIEIDLGADFKDMFDVRGMTPRQRAVPMPAHQDGDGDAIILAARGSDGQEICTRVSTTPAAEVSLYPGAEPLSGATLRFPVTLQRDTTVTIELRVQPEPLGSPLQPAVIDPGSDFAPRFSVHTPSEAFNAFIARCDQDLAMLQTTFPEGNIPAAGIPWYIAPFGRDSLIVGLQTMHAYPERIAATLNVLAALQGTREDPWREEEPGKILHEMRYGDMARTGQVPHTPYYGSIDSTPLFIMVFAQHYLWHRDDDLFERLEPNVRRALEWIDAYGDRDGDGLVEYTGVQQDTAHIAQQGWKDSGDSLHFADGRPVEGPIALVEVQGYVYAAYAWLSKAARLRGDDAWADDLAACAGQVREAVEAGFWMEDAGYYAQALDGRKRPVDAISSNPGHLLFCGLPSPERAAQVAKRMAMPELNAGWGIRTLSAYMATFNPMSYHNGSIWPHDVSLAMAGLQGYGHGDLARDLAMGLLALTTGSPHFRLAELYCGFPNMDNGLGPINYPVSCIPQAWAAGAGLLAVRTLLGLAPDVDHRGIVTSPHFPGEWQRVDVDGLHAFGRGFDLSIERSGDSYTTRINAEAALLR
jgi:glycogen debranching enzyme